MRVEILDARLYRGEPLEIGRITDMDEGTARLFIDKGWAKEASPAPVLTTEEAAELVPTTGKRRRAVR